MDNKIRLDLLFSKTYNLSRTNAKEFIENGMVFVDGKKVVKASEKILESSLIDFKGQMPEFVSRGGEKLLEAVTHFNINLKDKVCLDVGASTGGFTHCMLKYGAEVVFSLDNGVNQLSEVLLNSDKVVNMENTNVLDVDTNCFVFNDEKMSIDFVSVDVSFISVFKVIDKILSLINENAEGVILIKPQFEAGRKFLNKKGIVKDFKIHKQIINNTEKYLKSSNINVVGVIKSPITGRDGNIEYLLYFKVGF